jgi:hypothetical protein
VFLSFIRLYLCFAMLLSLDLIDNNFSYFFCLIIATCSISMPLHHLHACIKVELVAGIGKFKSN